MKGLLPSFKEVTTFAFDLDGTIYLGDELIHGALETVESLRSMNYRIVYFTNNSTKTRYDIYLKLRGMGINLEIDDIITSSYATALFVKEQLIENVYCIGEQGLIDELLEQNIEVCEDPGKAEHIVVGLYKNFSYKELSIVLNIYQRTAGKCRVIACNKDMHYPANGGKLLPGCGPAVAAIDEMIGGDVVEIVGKPNTFMIDLLASRTGIKKDQIAVVGDTYSSDMEMANRAGSPSIWYTNDKRTIKDVCVINELSEIIGLVTR